MTCSVITFTLVLNVGKQVCETDMGTQVEAKTVEAGKSTHC